MNTKQIKEYLDTVEFKLKDKASTEYKYKDYKTMEWIKFLKDHKEEIKNHFTELKDVILNELPCHPIAQYVKLTAKSGIRSVMPRINAITYVSNEVFVKWMLGDFTNKNTLRCFAIKLYLKYYEKINNIMKKALKEYVLYNIPEEEKEPLLG